ncbi:MAG TPA: peptidoglycan-binding protein [Candidatus Nealsonbacteria bacterium]|uniref:Peptidoglycan binding-like domain-containing protein n=1 Tax=marine sediment metagenome TaxID=412755 RepID=A0A0F9XMS2_9ZZZZ|nr:peptidoglycan-binding protein [Candidatus Nealsonbacteria bacterium]HEB46433.1 peptidoglycan-binding protein [Candidatus Nealsonbacteria bacterium]
MFQNTKYTLLAVILWVGFFFAFPVWAAGNTTGYAWGENAGWINFNPSQGEGVTVTNSAVAGYAWGENVGWINLNPTYGGVTNDGQGNLSGYAWGENVGWINFNPTGSQVIIDGSTGDFSGYAWGENVGWISFSCANCNINTSWRKTVVVTGGGGVISPPVSTTGQGNVYQNLGGEVRKTFESGELAKVVFPSYSIKGTVVVKIEPKDKVEAIKTNPLPKNTKIVGDLVADFTALSGGEELEKFEGVVAITFTYTDAKVKEVGVDEKTLKIYWWDKTTKSWKPLKSEVNTLTNTVTAQTIHFTLFALMGEIKEKPIVEMTVEELKQKIAEISEKINQLKVQLQQLLEKEVTEEIPTNYRFTINLKYDQTNDDVRYLQIFLKAQGPEIYPEGIVSGWFGPLTKKAVIRFQEKYAEDILAPWGLTEGTGFVGSTTRAKINDILGR